MIDDRVAVNLDRMLEAATTAVKLTGEMALPEFLADERSKLAVMMCFVIIGEAAGKIARHSPAFIEEHSEWPWSGMRAMRNVAAHAYANLEFAEVWKTAHSSLPDLIEQIAALGPLDPRERP